MAMKKLLFFFTIIFTSIIASAQDGGILNHTWFLRELENNGTVYEAPSNSEIDEIEMRLIFDVDIFYFQTSICSSVNCNAFPSSVDGYRLFNYILQEEVCMISENQEFQELYFRFFAEDNLPDLKFTYAIEEINSGTRELILTNQTGNTVTYRRNVLATEEFENISFTIYPNPTSETLYIQNLAAPIDSYAILDVTGKIILQGKLANETINVSGLQSGIYFLEISSEGKQVVKKFVKK
jgi:hypothetical protein